MKNTRERNQSGQNPDISGHESGQNMKISGQDFDQNPAIAGHGCSLKWPVSPRSETRANDYLRQPLGAGPGYFSVREPRQDDRTVFSEPFNQASDATCVQVHRCPNEHEDVVLGVSKKKVAVVAQQPANLAGFVAMVDDRTDHRPELDTADSASFVLGLETRDVLLFGNAVRAPSVFGTVTCLAARRMSVRKCGVYREVKKGLNSVTARAPFLIVLSIAVLQNKNPTTLSLLLFSYSCAVATSSAGGAALSVFTFSYFEFRRMKLACPFFRFTRLAFYSYRTVHVFRDALRATFLAVVVPTASCIIVAAKFGLVEFHVANDAHQCLLGRHALFCRNS